MSGKLRLVQLCTIAFVVCMASMANAGKKKEAPGPAKTPPKSPKKFQVKFETSKGDFVIEVVREWSPIGADRFYEAVKAGFYNECRFFRVVPGFVVQFGISGDPKVGKKWREATIKDDKKVVKSNLRGYVTYAKSSMPNTRTTQLFINYSDGNKFLDARGFSPFGKVITGLEKVVDKINPEYKERASQGSIHSQGNKYLKTSFPRMDYIKKATIVTKKKKKKKKK
jgi:peptidyl-prolyl cis-trans isomerase A (cyclophilin A)